ncbi:MAG: type III-B CRISPR-associated protein Cas10/Cmr2 [Thermoproteaceae archaeon]|nr:type III-B CRISPR-associated protein Cas10/Cmr2 [Thermoproteaceae archaeon]
MDWFAKAYALLHDPPHKALWFEDEKYRVFDKESHEGEARKMLDEMLRGTPLGGGAPSRDVTMRVKTADRIAASFDRWALPEPAGGYWAVAEALYNPFNLQYSMRIERPDPKAFRSALEDYIRRANEILRAARNDRETYVLLYAVAEPLWILKGLPALPADTRAPTHTVFDHLYATASMMNWVDGGGSLSPRGCLLEIDVPGIQRIIGSARKAGDYRAGSLLVSLAVWLTAWQYMRKYGPDVLLSPTPRFNPLFYFQLAREIKGGEIEGAGKRAPGERALELYAELVVKALGLKALGEEGREGGPERLIAEYFIERASVIPGTAYLALPDCAEAERAPEYFEAALSAIKDAACGSEREDLPLPVRPAAVRDNHVARLARRVLERTPALYLPLRHRCVSVEDALREAERVARELAPPDHLLRALGGERGLAERLLFYAAWRLLHRKVAAPRAPSWFSEGGRPNFVKLYEGPWIHSTLDPDQPASLRLGGVVRERRLDYDEETWSVLSRELGAGEGAEKLREELKKVFKPKEALGPVDVLKRALYYAVAGGGIPSVQETALRWYYNRGWAEACDDSVRRGIEEIVGGGDAEEIFGQPPAPDAVLRQRCKRKETDKPPMSFTYAIVRADGDYVGRLARGCVRGRAGGAVEQALEDVLPREARGDAERWREDGRLVIEAFKLVQKLRGKECEDATGEFLKEFPDVMFVVPSPSYYAALSASLMITALKDAKAVIERDGDVVFAGGDDLLAFAARPAALEIVEETRRAYHGDGGFHRLTDSYAVPAPAAYGRSYSVRLTHSITDFMAIEVDEASRLLEAAKSAVRGKDALVISASTGHAGVVRMLDVGEVERVVKAYLAGDLSRNLPHDMEAVYTPGAPVGGSDARRAEEILLAYTVRRNVRRGSKAGDGLVEALVRLHGAMWDYFRLEGARDRLGLAGPWHNMVELLKALREFL